MDKKLVFVIILLIASCVLAYFLLKEDEEDVLKNLSREQVKMQDTGGLKLSNISDAIVGLTGGGAASGLLSGLKKTA